MSKSHEEAAKKLMKEFANRLTAWMAANQVDYFELGKRLGVSGYQIRHLVRLENYPSMPLYWALCREMGLEPLPPKAQ